MRRLLLLMLTIVVSTMVLAGDVTPQQAWEKAKEFMQSREVTGSRRAHGSFTQKGQTSRVNGLTCGHGCRGMPTRLHGCNSKTSLYPMNL